MKKNDTNINEPSMTDVPKRGWCVVTSGLCAGKARIVTEHGFATKEDADEAARHAVMEAPVGAIGAKAVHEPKHCKVVRMVENEDGLLEPGETILEKAAFEDALDVVKQHSDAKILYTAWTDGKKIAVGAAVLAVALAAGIGVYAATAQPVPVDADAPAASQAQSQSPSPAKQAEKSDVSLTVKAEGAGSGATKVKVLAVDKDNKVALSEREVEANKEAVVGKLPAGDYDLYVTAAPVCDDGSTYKLPEKPTRFSVKDGGKDVAVSVELEKLPADKMTKEQLEASAAALEAAGKQEAAAKAREASSTAESRPGSESAIQNVPSTDGVSESNPDNGSGNNGGSSSNSGNGGGSGSTGGSTGNTTPKPEPEPSTPSHTHSWVEQTTTVHHDAVYNTVHHDAVYDTIHHDAVKEGRIVCNGCGAMFANAVDYGNHSADALLSGNSSCGSYYTTSVVVQEAWNETVLVNDAYDEQVLVSAAWDETVITGYTCSCGATK